jgi:hypothetical protein
MPWYYAGVDAQPVGPVPVEELQARRAAGALSPETYVLEQPDPAGQPPRWRRYREAFPDPTLPPLPPIPIAHPPPVPAMAAVATAAPPTTPAHALFPSAQRHLYTTAAGGPVFTGAHPESYAREHHVNGWCSWGFGLALGSVILTPLTCGFGFLLAIPALIVSLVGLGQVRHHAGQRGRGQALAGLAISIALLLLVTIVGVGYGIYTYRQSSQTTSEQSTNDSDSQ